MKINIMTLFPEMFVPLRESILGRAEDAGIIELKIVDIRDYTEDKHNRVDDTPFGGGAGMVMQVQPVMSCYRENGFGGRTIYMSPRGRKLSGELAEELSEEDELTILCGHYEGVDERALDMLSAEEISIGDYVLTGGELPAMVLVDTVARFLDGVLSSEESVKDESVYSGLLEYPQYTRPREYEGRQVPEVLTGGNHGLVDLWRFEQSLRITCERRPDLFDEYVRKAESGDVELGKKERAILMRVVQECR
jgi:tRNA (guanine37-N1)-methyltransferase